ncbi:MAG: hypothetical protein RBS78_07740 [Coriobacteriia bacterium]|nr:hypothetical protein [Coriobacteriia bacterium]
MARGTKLFQEPGSPLIQGRSRIRRPGWQPFVVGVACALAWSFLSHVLTTFALEGYPANPADVLAQTARAWFDAGLVWLVPSAMFGALIGMAIATMWGLRQRWIAAGIGGVGAWYLALLLAALLG